MNNDMLMYDCLYDFYLVISTKFITILHHNDVTMRNVSLKEELSKHSKIQQTQQDLLRQGQWLLVVIPVLIIALI